MIRHSGQLSSGTERSEQRAVIMGDAREVDQVSESRGSPSEERSAPEGIGHKKRRKKRQSSRARSPIERHSMR